MSYVLQSSGTDHRRVLCESRDRTWATPHLGGPVQIVIKSMRPIFEEISLFHKKNMKYKLGSIASLFALRNTFLPLSY